MLQNTKFIIAVSLFFYSFLFAGDIDVKVRSGTSIDLTQGSRVTNTPYGYYVDNFSKSSIKGFDKVNLSAYPNKHLLVGYGVFDINDANCRYLDVDNSSFSTDFKDISVIGNNTFAVSRATKTYPKCLEMAAKYSGFVYTPKSLTEYYNVTKQTKSANKSIWIGYTKTDSNSTYLNDEGIQQSYSNFLFPNKSYVSALYTTKSLGGTSYWSRSDGTEKNYCVVKIDSPDYMRPIKFCLPWWRVERTYRLNKNDDMFEYNGEVYDYKYMHYILDYPEEKTVCLENNTSLAPPPGSFDQSCESYDSYTASPACAGDSSLPICHINNCKGVIQDTCIKIDSYEPSPKNYKIGYVQNADGEQKKVKIKDNITVNVYKCPVSTVTSTSCIEKGVVNVFPFQCPGSKCDDLKICLMGKDSNVTVDDANSSETKADACMKAYPCEKNYGSVDSPQFDENGKLFALRGVCENGIDNGNATVEVKSKSKKTCESFNYINEEVKSVKKCVSESTKSDEIVQTSITSSDPYKSNPRCIRTNNLEEARPAVETIFDYKVNNFFSTAIVKAKISGGEEVSDTGSSSAFAEYASNLSLAKFNSTENRDITGDINKTQKLCEALVPSTTQKSRFYLLNNNYSGYISDFVGYLKTKSVANVDKCPSGYSKKNSRCERDTYACNGTYKSSDNTCDSGSFDCGNDTRDKNICFRELYYSYPIIGVSKGHCDSVSTTSGLPKVDKNILYSDYNFKELGISSELELNNFCFVGGNSTTGDLFDIIKGDGGIGVNLTTSKEMTSNACNELATCVSASVVSNVSKCLLRIDDNSSDDNNESEVKSINSSNFTLPSGEGSILGSINGYSDIYSIQEYLEGSFGYFSNYITKVPIENIVKINNKEVFPIEGMKAVNEKVKFSYDVKTTTQATKNEQPFQLNAYSRGYAIQSSVSAGYNFRHSGINGVETYLQDHAVARLYLTFLTAGVSEIVMLFAKKMKFGWYKTHYFIDKLKGDRWKENVYGYDPRISLEDGSNTLLYDKKEMFTGTMKQGDFLASRENLKKQKKNNLISQGYSDVGIEKMTNSTASSWNPSWKDVKWWRSHAREDDSRESNGVIEVNKSLKTVYMGAVNSMSIVVPYVGSYEVAAYDKLGEVLGTVTILKEAFVSNVKTDNNNLAESYAKVQFAMADNFNIADRQDTNTTSGSCLSSDYVEWGGGVSGAYYEDGVPDLAKGSNYCNKSNDAYVKTHSAVFVTVRSLDMVKPFVIKLLKPMPFANKIMLVNMMKVENRNYECWTDTPICTVNNEKNITSAGE